MKGEKREIQRGKGRMGIEGEIKRKEENKRIKRKREKHREKDEHRHRHSKRWNFRSLHPRLLTPGWALGQIILFFDYLIQSCAGLHSLKQQHSIFWISQAKLSTLFNKINLVPHIKRLSLWTTLAAEINPFFKVVTVLFIRLFSQKKMFPRRG